MVGAKFCRSSTEFQGPALGFAQAHWLCCRRRLDSSHQPMPQLCRQVVAPLCLENRHLDRRAKAGGWHWALDGHPYFVDNGLKLEYKKVTKGMKMYEDV